MSDAVNYVASTITTTFVPPANEVSVVGYYSSGTDVGTIVCGSEYEFLVSSTYGICCPTASSGDCGFRQSCTSSLMVYEDGSSFTCANNNPCVETTIYQRQPSDGWSATMAWCIDPDNPRSVYRSFVGTQLTLVPADSDATTTASYSESSTVTNSRDIPTPTDTTLTTSTSTTSPDSRIDPSGSEGANETTTPQSGDEDGSATNVGAIAGGVVGGVAGLVLVILALWFILRRQKKKNAELREIGAGYVAPEAK